MQFFLEILRFQICTCKQISWLNTCYETCNIDSNYACTTIYKMSEIAGGFNKLRLIYSQYVPNASSDNFKIL